MRISNLYLYDAPAVPQIRTNELAEFLTEKTGISVKTRRSFLEHHSCTRDALQLISSCVISDLLSPIDQVTTKVTPRSQEGPAMHGAPLYDGFELQKVLTYYIPESELVQDNFHLVFTDMLTCTYDYDDYRYHARAIICSNPALVSIPGIIEAPAKPRDYYFQVYEKALQGVGEEIVRKGFKGRFLEYGDDRLGLVAKGYALQAIMYYLTGDPFCESKDCILYNAHWQEDLLHAQSEIGSLCEQHKKTLAKS
ncbi:MAG: hypothetical protein KGI33_06115 [Thaumarchaeota archaeon]|nr:hypothetical protein [Nitrososphaerota archaeon]